MSSAEFAPDEWSYLIDTVNLLAMGLKREIRKGPKGKQVSSSCHHMKLFI